VHGSAWGTSRHFATLRNLVAIGLTRLNAASLLGFVGTIAANRPTRGIKRKRLLLASLKQPDQIHVEPIGDRGAIIRQPHAAIAWPLLPVGEPAA